MNKKQLIKTIKTIIGVTPKQTQIPELRYIKIGLSGSTVSLSGTDLSTGLCINLKTVHAYYGSTDPILVDGSTLLAAINACAGDVSFDVDGPDLVIRSGTDSHRIKLQDLEQYPIGRTADCDMNGSIPISARIAQCHFNEFAIGLAWGSLCAAKNKRAIYGYAGVRLRFTPDQLVIASQDGWRLSDYEISTNSLDTAPKRLDMLMPSQIVQILKNITETSYRMLEFAAHDGLYYVTDHEQFSIVWRDPMNDTDSPNFRDYDEFFPESHTTTSMPYTYHDEMLKAVRDVLPVAKLDPNNRVRLSHYPDKQELVLFAGFRDGICNSRTITGKFGQPFTVNLNCQWLLELLNAMPKCTYSKRTEIRIYCDGPENPVYFYTDRTRAVIMPIAQTDRP